MNTDMDKIKSGLRSTIRERLSRISEAVRAVESIELCDRLEPQLQSARTILFFSPLADELDVWPLLEKFLAAGKICALPSFDPVTQTYAARRVVDLQIDVVTGKFGVREPASRCEEMPLDRFDLILVPGVAFDVSGNRLGRGKGFYDRLLAGASGIKCGVGYDFQLLESVPTDLHDARVDFVFTPSRGLRRKV